MNAGPYLLIYSRHLPENVIKAPLTWSSHFLVCLWPSGLLVFTCLDQPYTCRSPQPTVLESNERFLSMLPTEMASKANYALSGNGGRVDSVKQEGMEQVLLGRELSSMDVADD